MAVPAVNPETDAPEEAELPYYWDVLPTKQLEVDYSYQRPLSTFHKKIESNFDPALVGVICVSQRARNKYAIIDGQTRVEALKNLGHARVPCIVYRHLKPKDEARMFWRFQTERKAIASAITYNAQVASGDPHVVALNDVIEGCGFRITETITDPHHLRNPGAWKWVFHGCTGAAAAANVEDVDGVARVLETMENAWPTLPVEAKTAEMVKALGLWIKKHPKADMQRLASQLGRTVPDDLLERAKLRRRSSEEKGSTHKWLSDIIDDQYHKPYKKRG